MMELENAKVINHLSKLVLIHHLSIHFRATGLIVPPLK